MGDRTIAIKQKEDAPIPEEILADAIVKIAQGFERAMRAGLTRRAVSLLIKEMLPSPVSGQPSRHQIEMVLQALPNLAAIYIRKPKP